MHGVVGIIHYMHGSEVKATPIDIVFKTLEDIEMHRFAFYLIGFHTGHVYLISRVFYEINLWPLVYYFGQNPF